jgi:hypothetical protein
MLRGSLTQVLAHFQQKSFEENLLLEIAFYAREMAARGARDVIRTGKFKLSTETRRARSTK